MRRAIRFGVLLLCLVATAVAQPLPGLAPEKLARVEQAITATMARLNVPAMSVAVANDNQLLWANGYGLADLENNVPAKAATVYRLGSISKPITATAVLLLVERGKIDLDAPVQQYCPAFPKKQWPVTTRQVLGHLSGIRHYAGEAEALSAKHYNSVVDGLAIFKDDPLLFEPGTKFNYSTYGYSVLGCEVEGASGQNFAEFVRENVFKPAGMDRIVVDEVTAIVPNRAQGYYRDRDGTLHNSTLMDSSYKIPGGGFASTVVDLVKFAVALQTGKLVKPETREQMWTPMKLADGKPTTYGMGWTTEMRDGRRVISHGGAQQRVTTYLRMRPDKGLVVAVMCNQENTRLADLAREIGDIVAGEAAPGR